MSETDAAQQIVNKPEGHPTVLSQRGSEAFFLRHARAQDIVVNVITVIKFGRFVPGDASVYPSAYVMGDRTHLDTLARFSTHLLVWNDHTGQWLLFSSRYDLSYEQAVLDLQQR